MTYGIYRAVRKTDGKWIEGFLLRYNKKTYICVTPAKCVETYSNDGESFGFEGFFEVNPKTVIQKSEWNKLMAARLTDEQ